MAITYAAILSNDEQKLIRAAIHCYRTGEDNVPFAELYRHYLDRIYRYVLVRSENSPDAQDITAQTFLAALENLHTYRHQASFAAWLFGIARRKIADHYRRTPINLSLEIAETSPTPPFEDEVARQISLEQIQQAIHTLEPARAEALTLYIFGDLSHAEVGQIMGRSEAAAKMLVHRAVNDLRQQLQEK